jgi:hypothetical protein
LFVVLLVGLTTADVATRTTFPVAPTRFVQEAAPGRAGPTAHDAASSRRD